MPWQAWCCGVGRAVPGLARHLVILVEHQIFHRQCCDAEQMEFDEENGAVDVSYDGDKPCPLHRQVKVLS